MKQNGDTFYSWKQALASFKYLLQVTSYIMQLE